MVHLAAHPARRARIYQSGVPRASTRLVDALRQAQASKVPMLIAAAETEFAPELPATASFGELAHAGDWSLAYSSAIRAATSMRIRGVSQHIESGTLENVVVFEWIAKVRGVLRIGCEYEFIGPARIQIALLAHTVRLDSAPVGDMQEMVAELQRALPPEIFDPSGIADHTVLAPHVRVSRFVGPRLAGVRDVFVRSGTIVADPFAAD